MRKIAWLVSGTRVITSTKLLGVTGESMAAEIVADVSALEALFPDADYAIIAIRPDGVKKPILGLAVPQEGIIRVGIASDVVAVPGDILLELRAYQGEVVALTLPVSMRVVASPVSEPDPEDVVTPSWAVEVLEKAEEIVKDLQETTFSQREDGHLIRHVPGKDDEDIGRVEGLSAYEVWVAAGNEGTEAEYLASLKGEEGKQGEIGPEGPQGPQGGKGDTGGQGETGATPALSIGTVETLGPGEDAYVTITGTAENPVLSMGLPQPDMSGALAEIDEALESMGSLEASVGAAEAVRQEREEGRVSAEEGRVTVEAARVAAEEQRVQSEGDRGTAEAARVTAEEGRTTGELQRVSAEDSRASAEAQRVANEVVRVAAETQRGTAETGRVGAEASRVADEQTRQANEGARQQGYARMDARIDEIVTPEGDPSLAELADVRVDAWGGAYASAGAHVRALDERTEGKAAVWPRTAIGGDLVLSPEAGSRMGMVLDADGDIVHAWEGGTETLAMQANVPQSVVAYGNDRLTASAGTITAHYKPSAEQTQGEVFVRGTASGELVTVEGAVKHKGLDVVLEYTAKQEGVPSPDAPVAIKGTELVEVAHSGANLLRGSWLAGGINGSGVEIASANYAHTDEYTPVVPGALYTLWAATATGGNLFVSVYDKDFHFLGRPQLSSGNVASAQYTPDVGDAYIRAVLYNSAVTIGIPTQSGLNIGASATPYAPHQSHTTTYTPDGPLYGLPGAVDTVDWGAGEITRRIGLAAFDGTENWAVTASNNETTRFGVVVQNGQPAGAGLCSHTSWTTNIAPDTISAGIASSPSVLYLRLPVSLVANTANAIKTYLAAQNAAGTPVQVLYELATPTTEPITVPVIPAYGGTEHIWSNADRVTVAYDMTAQAAYDKQQAQINALQALMTGG